MDDAEKPGKQAIFLVLCFRSVLLFGTLNGLERRPAQHREQAERREK
jgi:hypothetical protein